MNTRIKQLMDYKQISPSELADAIGVQRSNVTHVLQGRNKPGFQFISKLLETFPELNAKWLITGQGDMLFGLGPQKRDLFDTPNDEEVNVPPKVEEQPERIPENKQPEIVNSDQPAPYELKNLIPPTTKEIERIVVFFTDQTFKQYTPSN